MWKLLLKAAKFARQAHGAQKRADGSPYYRHPMAVARILWQQGCRQPELLQAAYLHDTLEDCKVNGYELYQLFGGVTAALVSAVTRLKGESYEIHCGRARHAGPMAMALKRADREHNNLDLLTAPAECAKLREKAAIKTAIMERIFSEKA